MCRPIIVLGLCAGTLGWAAPALTQTIEELEARVADARVSLTVAEAHSDLILPSSAALSSTCTRIPCVRRFPVR